MAYSQSTRMQARENWVNGHSDKENAKLLDILWMSGKDEGQPNDKVIARWRKQSKNPRHSTHNENWKDYRDQAQSEDAKRYSRLRQRYDTERIEEILVEKRDFDRKNLATLKTIAAVIRNEITPPIDPTTRRPLIDEQTGRIQPPDPDYQLLKSIKAATDSYTKVSGMFNEALNLPELDEKIGKITNNYNVEVNNYETAIDKLWDEANIQEEALYEDGVVDMAKYLDKVAE